MEFHACIAPAIVAEVSAPTSLLVLLLTSCYYYYCYYYYVHY